RYSATEKGLAAKGKINAMTDILDLVTLGYVDCEGLRYEDFLPFSAAGIFASNLGQYGTKSTAAAKPVYSQSTLEEIMDKKIIDSNDIYSQLQEQSIDHAFSQLGLSGDVSE